MIAKPSKYLFIAHACIYTLFERWPIECMFTFELLFYISVAVEVSNLETYIGLDYDYLSIS